LIESLFVLIGSVIEKLWNGTFWQENSLWECFWGKAPLNQFFKVFPYKVEFFSIDALIEL
jgi:hypothetical protein